MSKYVRTEDRIIDTEKEFSSLVTCGTKQEFANLLKKNFNCVYVSDDDKNIHANCGGEQIKIPYVKQADSIEELCDWFVTVWSKDGHTEYCTYYDLDRDLFQSLTRAKFTVYGAIWTDKGLIYVAKMNEKGELELL